MLGSFILYDSPSSGYVCHPFTNENEPWAGSRALAVLWCGFANTCHLPGVSADGSMALSPCLGASACRAPASAPLSPLRWKDWAREVAGAGGGRCRPSPLTEWFGGKSCSCLSKI